jgi:hypothetical protein
LGTQGVKRDRHDHAGIGGAMLWQPLGRQVLEQLAERPPESLAVGNPPGHIVWTRIDATALRAVEMAFAVLVVVSTMVRGLAVGLSTHSGTHVSRRRERLERGPEHVRLHVGQATGNPAGAVTQSSHADLGYVHGPPLSIFKPASQHGDVGVEDLDPAVADDPEAVVGQHRRLLDESGLCLCDGLRRQVGVDGTDGTDGLCRLPGRWRSSHRPRLVS